MALRSRALGAWLVIITALSACQYPARDLPQTSASQAESEGMQSRAFDTTERERTLRAIIAALQDLGFIVDRADYALGSVSGTKLDDYSLRMTGTVRPHGTGRLLVQAEARYIVTPVLDPGLYRQFFAALGRVMSLEPRPVD